MSKKLNTNVHFHQQYFPLQNYTLPIPLYFANVIDKKWYNILIWIFTTSFIQWNTFPCFLTLHLFFIIHYYCKSSLDRRKLKSCPLYLWQICFSSLLFGFMFAEYIYFIFIQQTVYLFTSDLIVSQSKTVDIISTLLEDSQMFNCKNSTSLLLKAHNWNSLATSQ